VGRTTGGRQAGQSSRHLRDRILAGLETFLVMDNMELGTVSVSVADPDPDPYVSLPDPDPLVRGMDPDPSITNPK
jgi:hypothetical protein